MILDATSSGITSNLVMLALDGASARHAAIATNVANSSNEDHRPVVSRFDALIGQIRADVNAQRPDAALNREIAAARSALQAQPFAESESGARVALDMEMAKLARNTLHYQALLAAQGKNMSILRMAIKEGRG